MSPQRRRQSLIAAAMTSAISFVVFTVFGVVYVTRTVNSSEKQLCDVLYIGSVPRPKPPTDPTIQPKTEYGKQLQTYNLEVDQYNERAGRALRNLSHEIDCPQGEHG